MLLLFIIALWSCSGNNKSIKTEKPSDLNIAKNLLNRDSYDSAAIYFNKSAQDNYSKKNYDLWIEGIQGLIDCIKLSNRPDSALKICDSIILKSKSLLDTSGLSFASLIHKKGILYSDMRQFDLAYATLSQCISLHLNAPIKIDTSLALSYNALGNVFLFTGQNDSAYVYYTKSANLLEAAKRTNSSDYASSIQNIGIYYTLKGNFEKAEEYFLKSIAILKAVTNENSSKLATNYLNMGRFYQVVRNDSKTLEFMKMAEKIYNNQKLNNSANAGYLFLNMGVIYIYTADYEKANSYLNQSLQIISEKASKNSWDLQTIYLNLGFIAEKQKNYLLAKEKYLKGLSYGDNWQNSVKILRGLASVSNYLKLVTDADTYYKLAIKKSIENYGPQHAETALTYLKYGDFLSANKNDAALNYLFKSLEIYKSTFGDKNTDVSTAYFYIGRYFLNQNNYEKALVYLQLSLIASQSSFSSNDFNNNPQYLKSELSENTLNPIITKASVLFLLFNENHKRLDLLIAANKTFQFAISMIEQMRSTYQSEESKLQLSENMRSTITFAIRAQEKLYEITKTENDFNKTFEICEKGKSAILLSYLRDIEAKNDTRIPLKLRKEDESIKTEIYSYNKLIYDEKLKSKPDDTKISLWNKKLFELNRQQDQLIQRFEKEFPAYFTLKYDNSTVSPNQIQKKLTPNQALISYSIADSLLYTFVFTKNEKKLYTKILNPEFFENLEMIRQSLQGQQFQNYNKIDFIAFSTTAHQIYKDVLESCETIIKGKDLIIIPDAELSYLSFDVLLTKPADTSKMNYRKLPYLIKQSSISYAPSASTFINKPNSVTIGNNGKIIAFAPDYGIENDVMKQRDEDGKLLKNKIVALDNTSDEVSNLKYYKNANIFLGSKATESLFKKKADRYRILHLAMHALVNTENPLYTKLLFFKAEGDTTEDGMLNASELLNMQLSADLAVLSACNTGNGKMQKGEGVMSLARDFFYAGVPSIVMTSWNAREKSSENLMAYFYKYINQGKPKNEALRLAKLEFLENSEKLTTHPHYWASYMVIGDISPLPDFNKRTQFYGVLILFILTMLSIITISYIILKKQRKQTKIISN